jgi:uncharacterized protein (DUF58 family)
MAGRNLTMAGVIWLMVFLLLFTLAIAKGIGLLLLFSCWLGAALAWNFLKCPLGLSRAHAAINDDDTLEAGLPGRVCVQVWLEGGGDPVPVRLSIDGQPGHNVVLGNANQEVWIPMHPVHRGWTQLPEAWLGASGPYGLVEARLNVLANDRILVLPRQGKIEISEFMGWLRQRRDSGATEVESSNVLSAVGEEFHGLRAWRAGDSPRLVHWRTTARTGVKMVREHEQPKEEALVVLIEPNESNSGEELVDLAASLVSAWGRGGLRWLGLVVMGSRPVVLHTQGATTPVAEMLAALAACGAGDGVAVPGSGWRRGAPVVRLAVHPGEISKELQGSLCRWISPSELERLRWYEPGREVLP